MWPARRRALRCRAPACGWHYAVVSSRGRSLWRLRRQADKISSVLKAAGVSVEPYWPGLFAKTLAVQNLDALITNIGAGTRPARRRWLVP